MQLVPLQEPFESSVKNSLDNQTIPRDLELKIREQFDKTGDKAALEEQYSSSIIHQVLGSVKNEVEEKQNADFTVGDRVEVTEQADIDFGAKAKVTAINGRLARIKLDDGTTARFPFTNLKKISNAVDKKNKNPSKAEMMVEIEDMIEEGWSRGKIINHLIYEYGIGETGAGMMYQEVKKRFNTEDFNQKKNSSSKSDKVKNSVKNVSDSEIEVAWQVFTDDYENTGSLSDFMEFLEKVDDYPNVTKDKVKAILDKLNKKHAGLYPYKNDAAEGTDEEKKENASSKAGKVMSIDASIMAKYGFKSGLKLAEKRDEFIERVRKEVGPITQEDADELEDQNFHTAYRLLREA